MNPVATHPIQMRDFIVNAQFWSSSRGERIDTPFASGTPIVIVVPVAVSSPNRLYVNTERVRLAGSMIDDAEDARIRVDVSRCPCRNLRRDQTVDEDIVARSD